MQARRLPGRSRATFHPSGAPSATAAEQMGAGADDAGHCCHHPQQDRVPQANLRVSLIIPLASEMRSPTAVSGRSFEVARLYPSCRECWERESPAANLERLGGILKRDILKHSKSVQRFWDIKEQQTHPLHPHWSLFSPITFLRGVHRPAPSGAAAMTLPSLSVIRAAVSRHTIGALCTCARK